METPPPDCDVLILGGSLAGAATATLLLRERPDLRVIVVEKSVRFPRRVGEATVEVSGYFLSRVLGLTQFLNETQLTKQGMRFWFSRDDAHSLADCSEIGGRYLARVPAWQVDRSTLDEEVLRRAVAAGAVLWRPAKALRVHLVPGGLQEAEVETESGRRWVSARWVVDASGFTCLLSRQEGWFRRNEAHPTSAAWARWTGVKDWDHRHQPHRGRRLVGLVHPAQGR
jgi:flavin-dependent dehydrogenase